MKFLEKIRVRACSHCIKGLRFRFDFINQKPIGRDVQFPMTKPVPNQRMVFVKRNILRLEKLLNDEIKLGNIHSSFSTNFQVFLKRIGYFEIEHFSAAISSSTSLSKSEKDEYFVVRPSSTSMIALMVSLFGISISKGIFCSLTKATKNILTASEIVNPMLLESSLASFFRASSRRNFKKVVDIAVPFRVSLCPQL